MRPSHTPQAMVDGEVASNTAGDVLECSVWRGGQQLTNNLPVSSYQMSWDASRYVHGQGSFVFADRDGDLWPRQISDALGVAGSRLHLTYRFGLTGTEIPMGVWRIRETDPHEFWQYRRLAERWSWLPGGGHVTVRADEELVSLELDRIDVGDRSPRVSQVLLEVQRLADPYMEVRVHPEVRDQPLRADIEYGADRLEVIQILLDSIGATYRQTPDRVLEIIPAAGTRVDWTVEPGNGGSLIKVEHSMSDADLANGVTAHATIQNAWPLTGPENGWINATGNFDAAAGQQPKISGYIPLDRDRDRYVFEYSSWRVGAGAGSQSVGVAWYDENRNWISPIRETAVATVPNGGVFSGRFSIGPADSDFPAPNGAAYFRVWARNGQHARAHFSLTGGSLQGEEEHLIARTRVTSGPIQWGGPFGRVPVFHGANLATSLLQVEQEAITRLATIVQRGDVLLTLSTLAHPGLQLHDRVALVAPDFPDPEHLSGRVQAMTLTATDGCAHKSMALLLAVDHREWTGGAPEDTITLLPRT